MIVYAPLNEIELRNILYTAQLGLEHPLAIRYPRGRGTTINWQLPFERVEIGKAHCIKTGKNTAVLSTGTIGNNVIAALEENSETAHYSFPFVKPLDEKLLHEIFTAFDTIITLEDGVIKGGFGSGVTEFAAFHNYKSKIISLGIPDEFIEHGSIEALQRFSRIDVKSLQNLFSAY